jgi:lysozyme
MENKIKVALDLIKKFEGFRELPYFATPEEERRKLLTIGYGFTTIDGRPVKLVDKMPQGRADDILATEIEHIMNKVVALTGPLGDNQLAALTSFVFNVGLGAFTSSTMLKLIKQGHFDAAAAQFDIWNKQAGKVLPGLSKRRADEKKVFLS